jgi:hypothetical protein
MPIRLQAEPDALAPARALAGASGFAYCHIDPNQL